MKKIKLQHHLLMNLRNRMEYNERTSLYKISGTITIEEVKAFTDAVEIIYNIMMEDTV